MKFVKAKTKEAFEDRLVTGSIVNTLTPGDVYTFSVTYNSTRQAYCALDVRNLQGSFNRVYILPTTVLKRSLDNIRFSVTFTCPYYDPEICVRWLLNLGFYKEVAEGDTCRFWSPCLVKGTDSEWYPSIREYRQGLKGRYQGQENKNFNLLYGSLNMFGSWGDDHGTVTRTKEKQSITEEFPNQQYYLLYSCITPGEANGYTWLKWNTINYLSGDIQNSIGLIEDTNQIYANGRYYQAIPQGGSSNQLITKDSSGEVKWANLSDVIKLRDIYAYGVQWTKGQQDPTAKRVGNLSYHKTLPIQSKMAGCIAQWGKVIYWLNPDDWRLKRDPEIKTFQCTVTSSSITIGDPSLTNEDAEKNINRWVKIDNVGPFQITEASVANGYTITLDQEAGIGLPSGTAERQVEFGSRLDGYDGTVRVYIPQFYIKSFVEGDSRAVYISERKIDDTWTFQPAMLIDAYRAVRVKSIPSGMGFLSSIPNARYNLVSINNKNSYCRGARNNSKFDSNLTTNPFYCDLGKGDCAQALSTYRERAKRFNTEVMSYEQNKNIIWLAIIEFGTFYLTNSKVLGLGFNQPQWMIDDYQAAPMIPNGYMDSYGNNTATESVTINSLDGSKSTTVNINKYRGIEMFYGDGCTILEGFLNERPTDATTQPYDQTVYITTNPLHYSNDLSEVRLYADRVFYPTPYTPGYFSDIYLGETADIIPIPGTEVSVGEGNYINTVWSSDNQSARGETTIGIANGTNPLSISVLGTLSWGQDNWVRTVNLYEQGIPDIPYDIWKNTVLWYNIKKQGLTNSEAAAGFTIRDLSGHGRTPSVGSGFNWTTTSGINGDYLQFDGVDDYVWNFPYHPMSEVTMVFKIDVESASGDGAAIVHLPGFVYFFLESSKPGYVGFRLGTEASYGNKKKSFSDIAGISSTYKLYYTDGSIDDMSQVSATTNVATGARLYLAHQNTYYKMKFYSLAIFDRILTDEEFYWVYNNMINT